MTLTTAFCHPEDPLHIFLKTYTCQSNLIPDHLLVLIILIVWEY